MKKNTLFVALLLLAAFLLQNCNKDSISATTDAPASTIPFQATINDTVWVPTKVTAAVTYTAATKNKVFTCTATGGTQQINMAVIQANGGTGNGFVSNTYSVDPASPRVALSYAVANSSNVFVPLGTVNSGYVIISSVDSVNMVMSGTFGFNTIKKNFDNQGNLISISSNGITAGVFNSMPYAYKKN